MTSAPRQMWQTLREVVQILYIRLVPNQDITNILRISFIDGLKPHEWHATTACAHTHTAALHPHLARGHACMTSALGAGGSLDQKTIGTKMHVYWYLLVVKNHGTGKL